MFEEEAHKEVELKSDSERESPSLVRRGIANPYEEDFLSSKDRTDAMQNR